MKKTAGMILLLIGVAGVACAGITITPEIDASAGVSAVTLLGGAFIIVRARRKR